MREIEKLYKLAGVKKITLFKPKHSITLGDYDEEYIDYPSFTAEKQIDLIKWLAKKNLVVYNNLGGWHLGIAQTYSDELGIICKDKATSIDSIEEAIAGLINNLWQDLTEEDKQKIKEILE